MFPACRPRDVVDSRPRNGRTRPCTGICIVRSLAEEEGVLIIRASGLAVGTGYSIPNRSTIFDSIRVDSEDEQFEDEEKYWDEEPSP
jgi:hypothetical protein